MPRMIPTLACACVLGFAAACSSSPTSVEPILVMIDQQIGALTGCTTAQLTVSVTDAVGQAVVPDSVRWVSSDPASASVSSSGLVRALKATQAVTISVTAFAGKSTGQGSLRFGIPAFPTSCGSR